MRFTYFTILLFFAIAIKPAFAQQGFHIGVNTTVANTYLIDHRQYGDVDYVPRLTFGPIFGIAAGNNFTDHFGFQVEVNYAQLGQKYQYRPGIEGERTGKVSLEYMQVPVLFKFSGGDYRSRFSAMMGPQFSYLSGAANQRGSGTNAVEATHHFNRNDIGILMAAGGDISLVGDLYLNMELRMYYGFNQINKNQYIISDNTARPDKLGNAYAGFNVGLHYLLRPASSSN